MKGASAFNLAAYLMRIGLDSHDYTPPTDEDGLSHLMRQQLFSVVFENTEVQLGRLVSMDPAVIYQKIVRDKRGGYCYEVNGLFAQALNALGISSQFVAARPMFYPMLRPKTHMALVVTLGDERYLCDLGFGSYGIRAPIPLSRLNVPIVQDFDRFMLSCDTDPNADPYAEYVLQAWVNGAWVKQYSFNLSPQLWVDFVPANYLNTSHPDAIFVQKLLLIKHRLEGRTILLGDHLKIITADGCLESTVAKEGLSECVWQHFGLVW